jgi:hypothetical protein
VNEQPLVLYDQMRWAIAQCVAIDEVAGIKDQAAQLEAYARVRDDAEAQRQFAEIRLRACMRIGEISRDLEPSKGGRPPKETNDTDVASFKQETLAQAGINIRTAERYEELIGGREQQAQTIAVAAAESYFADRRHAEEPVSIGGLKAAVRSALTQAFGEKPVKSLRQEKPREPDLLTHFLYSADYYARKRNFEPRNLAQEVMEEFAQDSCAACREFIPLMETFVSELSRRFSNVK